MNINEIKYSLIKIINSSNTINKQISNKVKNQLIESIIKLSDKNTNKLFSILEKIFFRKIEGRDVEKALFVAGLPIPLPFASLVLVAAYRMAAKYYYKCSYNCRFKKNDLDKTLCYKKCKVLTIQKTISKIEAELEDCWYDKNPEKCRKNTIKYLDDLYKRLEKAKISLNNYQTKIRIKNKKNAKL